MLVAAGIARDVDDGKARMKHALESGAGLAKLKEMIAAQGGDAGVCDDVTRLPQAKHLVPVPAPHDGYVAVWIRRLSATARRISARAANRRPTSSIRRSAW